MNFLLSHAAHIACISNSTRADLIKFAQSIEIPTPDITTLLLGSEISCGNIAARPQTYSLLKSREFVLCVGNINIRKNHVLLPLGRLGFAYQ